MHTVSEWMNGAFGNSEIVCVRACDRWRRAAMLSRARVGELRGMFKRIETRVKNHDSKKNIQNKKNGAATQCNRSRSVIIYAFRAIWSPDECARDTISLPLLSTIVATYAFAIVCVCPTTIHQLHCLLIGALRTVCLPVIIKCYATADAITIAEVSRT